MAKRKVIKKAPLNKRIFAFLIDWYFGWVFAAIPVGWLWNVLTREKTINTDILVFEKPYGLLAGVLGILFGIVYYPVLPYGAFRAEKPRLRPFGYGFMGSYNLCPRALQQD